MCVCVDVCVCLCVNQVGTIPLHIETWKSARTDVLINFDHKPKQEAQLSQKDCAARCIIVLAKSGRLELGDNILQTL